MKLMFSEKYIWSEKFTGNLEGEKKEAAYELVYPRSAYPKPFVDA